jgi:hypothetical protein
MQKKVSVGGPGMSTGTLQVVRIHANCGAHQLLQRMTSRSATGEGEAEPEIHPQNSSAFVDLPSGPT